MGKIFLNYSYLKVLNHLIANFAGICIVYLKLKMTVITSFSIGVGGKMKKKFLRYYKFD